MCQHSWLARAATLLPVCSLLAPSPDSTIDVGSQCRRRRYAAGCIRPGAVSNTKEGCTAIGPRPGRERAREPGWPDEPLVKLMGSAMRRPPVGPAIGAYAAGARSGEAQSSAAIVSLAGALPSPVQAIGADVYGPTQQKRWASEDAHLFSERRSVYDVYDCFLRRIIGTRPTRPVPRRAIEDGSGVTIAVPLMLVG